MKNAIRLQSTFGFTVTATRENGWTTRTDFFGRPCRVAPTYTVRHENAVGHPGVGTQTGVNRVDLAILMDERARGTVVSRVTVEA